MGTLGAVLLGLGFSALMGGAVYAMARQVAKMKRNLQDAADRFGGKVLPGGVWRHTRLVIDVDGVPGELTYFMGTDKAPPWTRLRFSWTPPAQMRIIPEGFFASIRKFFGAVDIQVGDPEFDAAFLIQGKPEDWVRQALGAEARRLVVALRDVGTSRWRGKGIRVDLGPTGLMLFVQRNLTQERAALEGFLEHAIGLLGVLRGWQGAALQVLSVAEAIAAGRCVVCGNALEEPIRRCETCKTPHHAECWDYFGGCAIFGCEPRAPADLGKDGKKGGK